MIAIENRLITALFSQVFMLVKTQKYIVKFYFIPYNDLFFSFNFY